MLLHHASPFSSLLKNFSFNSCCVFFFRLAFDASTFDFFFLKLSVNGIKVIERHRHLPRQPRKIGSHWENKTHSVGTRALSNLKVIV